MENDHVMEALLFHLHQNLLLLQYLEIMFFMFFIQKILKTFKLL